MLVTKDDDFLDLSALYGPPPVVIRLAFGNCSNTRVLDVLCSRQQGLAEALQQPGIGLIELG